MKTIAKYILMAAVVLMATACEKDSILSQYEGGVNFDIKMSSGSRTTSTEGSDVFTPEQMRVRIYRGDGALIRRYTKSSDIPSPLYLVEGSYSVVVDAGNLDNVAFKEPATADERKQKLCYAGSSTFTVGKNATANVEVNCPTINSKVTIGFDKKDSESDNLNSLFENRYLTNVQIKVAAISADGVTNFETLSAKADEADAPNLLFTYEDDDTEGGTQSGYFLMPEGVKSLIWAFKATHATDGEINTSGVVSKNVEAGKDYRVNFKYARTPDGAGGITVRIDESVETFPDEYKFKPQPEIIGEGFDVTVASAYKDQAVVFYCESIYDLYNLSLNGSNFFDGGNVNNEHNITGLTCEKETDTKVKITLAPEYFVNFPSGAINLSFDMQDKDGDKVSETYPQKVVLMKQGFMELSNPNLWANTADISAVVTKENVNSVGFKIRKKGTNDWSEEFSASNVPAEAGDGFRIFKASTVASWTESENPNGHKIYTPNVAKSIFAGNTYEIQTVIDGVEYGSIREYAAPASAQAIPYATFEDSSLSCFGTSNSSAPYWGSGNNNFTSGLCTHSNKAGMQGEHCALLTSSTTLGMLASGNLFTGQFDFDLSSQKGTVSFGIDYDWQHRPSAMTVKYWRDIKMVTSTKYAEYIKKDDPDQASIYVCIIDWNSQHKVTSGSGGNPTGVWSPENGADASSCGKVIGYGVVYPTGKTTGDSMETLTIPIQYYDKVTKPTGKYKLIISAATSRYGDYMNGAAGSTMYLDDFQWGY
ncbi:MAG: PCMD domain-containing protein [Alistipes sp.]|nr:PCMD domain-containing protein [Alistipes sp.]